MMNCSSETIICGIMKGSGVSAPDKPNRYEGATVTPTTLYSDSISGLNQSSIERFWEKSKQVSRSGTEWRLLDVDCLHQ